MGKFIDLTGRIYGRLKVVSFAGITDKKTLWLCLCECGKYKKILQYSIMHGITKSCGCISIEKGRARGTHRETNKTKEYKTWAEMKFRCLNKTSTSYHHYGGRGITVCVRWIESYENFLADMGRAPTKDHSIDRINVNGNYEPSNCKWSTDCEQANNRRNSRLITLYGSTKTLAQWCHKLGVNYNTMSTRIYRGWKHSEAIEKSTDKKLSKEQVIEIRSIKNIPNRPIYKEIAKQYGVSYNMIFKIMNNKVWKLADNFLTPHESPNTISSQQHNQSQDNQLPK